MTFSLSKRSEQKLAKWRFDRQGGGRVKKKGARSALKKKGGARYEGGFDRGKPLWQQVASVFPEKERRETR